MKENETWTLSAEELADDYKRTGVPNLFRKGSEIVELYLSIQDSVTSLLQLSTIIRKKPQTDEYIKAQLQFPDMDASYDISHISDRYPESKKCDPWLRNRLGTAITRRRQYLMYRKEHQEKMEKGPSKVVGGDGKTIQSRGDATTYFSVDDTRGTFQPNESTPIALLEKDDLRTVYTDSRLGKDGSSYLLRTPLLPKDKDGRRADYGDYFECQFCRRIVIVTDKQHWKYVDSAVYDT